MSKVVARYARYDLLAAALDELAYVPLAPLQRSWPAPSGNVAVFTLLRNLLSVVPKDAQQAVAAIMRMIFSEPDHASAMAQLRQVASTLSTTFPQAAALLEDAAENVLSHLHFPPEHRRRLHFHKPARAAPQGGQKKDQRGRHLSSRTVRRFSVRLVGSLLAEQDDEWQVSDRRYFSVGSMERIEEAGGEIQKELLAAIA